MARTLHLEHHVKGRARIRVPQPRTPEEVAEVARQLKAIKRVRRIEVNSSTGSVLLHHDPEDPVEMLLEDIAGIGYLVQKLTAARSRGRARARKVPPRVPHSQGSRKVSNALATMNQKVHEATDGRADLRLIVPAALGALAIRQVLKDAKSLSQAPWYVLVYYAFDSFYKLNDEMTEPPTS
ncbi:MAG: HMA2 domain-containing protein [Candidatus Dormibacteria bacterium]